MADCGAGYNSGSSTLPHSEKIKKAHVKTRSKTSILSRFLSSVMPYAFWQYCKRSSINNLQYVHSLNLYLIHNILSRNNCMSNTLLTKEAFEFDKGQCHAKSDFKNF
jgi:hypothetical protein